MKPKDLTGMRFGKLIALEDIGRSKDRHRLWKCKCDCGNETTAPSNMLATGQKRSCGCLMLETNTKHSQHKTRLYQTWANMLQRCSTPGASRYDCYGGRGITVCEEWHSFNTFFEWAISSGFLLGLTLDRIDVNKGYEPSNCRWATRKEQGNNRRTNTLITFNGKTQTMTQWAEEIGITRHTLWARLHKCKMPLEIALTAKKNEYNRWNRKEKLNG